MKAVVILTLSLLIAFPASAGFFEGANSIKATAPVTSSSWSSFKSWAKTKAKKVNKDIKKKYGVDVIAYIKGQKPKSAVEQKPVENIAAGAPIEPVAPDAAELEKNNRINELSKAMPTYSTDEAKESLSSVESFKNKLTTAKVLNVSSPGLPADPSLKKDRAGVAKFSLFKNKKVKSRKTGKYKTIRIKIKDLPKLNVGVESTISKNDFSLEDINILAPNYKVASKLASPDVVARVEVMKWLNKRVRKIKNSRKIAFKDHGVSTAVTQELIDKLNPIITQDVAVAEKPVQHMSKNELNMLASLLLLAQGDQCHAVAGLLDGLAKVPNFAEEANFHLGMCSHEMGFYSESTDRLIKVVKNEAPHYAPKAIKVLTSNLPVEYEVKVARTLKGIKNKSLIPDDTKDNFHYILAKAASTNRAMAEAAKWANKVSINSDKYPKAQFILSVSQYVKKQNKNSIKTLLGIRKWFKEKKKSDSDVQTLVSVNLGRMYFQIGNYKQSHIEYLKVSKDHPLWVTALIEQGWSQLRLGDSAGAIGNMYSLHSPFFKTVFMPESYAVRTIGYLNICQYGDAYQTLGLMEKKHRPWLSQINAYIRKNKHSKRFYSTLVKYLSGKSTVNTDGLPFQVIREMARRRNFLNVQSSLNQKADELAQFKFISQLILKDKAKMRKRRRYAKSQVKKMKHKIKYSKKNQATPTQVQQWQGILKKERVLDSQLRFKLAIYEQSRQGFLKLKKRVSKRIRYEKGTLLVKARIALKGNLKVMKREMSRLVENNEFLRYEVFAGSGENMRYQAAGGKVEGKHRLPASIKPKKALTWSVTGEFWEDEIGRYRSALRNNCPKSRKYSLPPAARRAQAN